MVKKKVHRIGLVIEDKMEMVFKDKKSPSVSEQCDLIGLPKATFYRKKTKKKASVDEPKIKEAKEKILKLHESEPSYGARRLKFLLSLDNVFISRFKTRQLMKELNIKSLSPGPNTSSSKPEHYKYPYLLRHLDICKPNMVWCTDITYIRIKGAWVYLVAVLDWYSRRVISWRLSNTLETSFCIEALGDALRFGTPEIFNTDQGSQFTSNDFIKVLLDKGIKISMDGKGRASDNVIIERFWRSIKYERIYLNDCQNMSSLRTLIREYIDHYNFKRPHQTHNYAYPDDVWKGLQAS